MIANKCCRENRIKTQPLGVTKDVAEQRADRKPTEPAEHHARRGAPELTLDFPWGGLLHRNRHVGIERVDRRGGATPEALR